MASESSSQPNVRIIPIQVEGRDYVGRHEEPARTAEPTAPHQQEQPPRVSSGSSMGFGTEIPTTRHHFQPHERDFNNRMHFDDDFADEIAGFRHGSIFDKAKDFPVRSFFQQHPNPARTASPGRQNMPFTQAGAGQSQSQSPPRQQQQRAKSPQQQQPNKQQPQQQRSQQSQQQQPPPQEQEPVERQKSPTPQPPPPTKMKEDSIDKIKNIQREVLELMDQVEHFQATGRRDKRYLYLDEMLTQNLLKLDTVDTEGKDNIKQARREAIKCINHCISVLEAKVEAAEEELKNMPAGTGSSADRSSSAEKELSPAPEPASPSEKKSASADNVLKPTEQSAELQKSSSQK